MKIIGVSGGSGAGKSTVSKKLAELLPNSLLITGDVFMHEESKILEKEIFKRLGIKKDENIFSYNYYFESFNNVKVWADTIKENVIAKVNAQIQNEGLEKDYIIVDWVFLPMCEFFKNCDYTICVKTNYEIRKVRLTERLQDKTIYNDGDRSFWSYRPGSIERRLKFTALNEYDFKSEYEITNNGDTKMLYKKVEDMVYSIVNNFNLSVCTKGV